MKKPVWLDRADCLAIHEMMLARHGGLAGVGDEGLLESALGKPLNVQAYASPTLPELAASYATGIILNHAFIDGNKRTGFLMAVTFLELNGREFVASEESVVKSTIALAAGEFKESEYAAWLTENSRKA